MASPETAQELSDALTEVLLREGKRLRDRIEILKHDSILGSVKLNDYWNGFHVNHEGARHYDDPDSFYREGHTPILSIAIGDHVLENTVIHTFRPTDISRRGMGTILIRHLPEDIQQATEVIATKDDVVIIEPFQDAELLACLGVLLGSTPNIES